MALESTAETIALRELFSMVFRMLAPLQSKKKTGVILAFGSLPPINHKFQVRRLFNKYVLRYARCCSLQEDKTSLAVHLQPTLTREKYLSKAEFA
jgi:hypothetical protein